MSMLPQSAQSVEDFLRSHGESVCVNVLPDSTATAEDAALAVGTTVDTIGKSIVFLGLQGLLVVVVPGDRLVDLDTLVLVTGDNSLRKASAREVKEGTGFPIGGVSPFSLPNGTQVIVDSSLLSLESCWVAAGHPKAVVRVPVGVLVSLSGAKVHSVSRLIGSRS